MLKKLLTVTWTMFLFACCQLAAAAPSVSVTATPNNPAAPATVTLSVVVTTDAEPVTVTQVEYFSGVTSLGMALQDPFALVLNGLAAGTYQITAKAYTTDSNNPVLQSPPVSLTVGAAPGAATAYFIHTDQLNTPRVISDAGGAMVWQWDSDPFGKDAANEQAAGQTTFSHNQRFPGQQFDRESNLHYNYFRDYDPALGRYIQSDPIGLRGGINTFGYVGGNPIKNIDPRGLDAPPGLVEILRQIIPNSENIPTRPIEKGPSGEQLQCMRKYIDDHYGRAGDFFVPTLSLNSWYDNSANLYDEGPIGNLKETFFLGGGKAIGLGVVNKGLTGVQSAAVVSEAIGLGSSINAPIFGLAGGMRGTISGGVKWGGRLAIPAMVYATKINQDAAQACGCEK